MEFKLDEGQVARLKVWQEEIKNKTGEYGSFVYRFIPTGIGCIVEVVSQRTGNILDLSDVEKW